MRTKGSNAEMVTSKVLNSVLFGMVNRPAIETAFPTHAPAKHIFPLDVTG